MNVLFLSNDAPNYFHFFNELARLFSANGSQVFFAVDCKFSRKKNKLDELSFEIHDFAAFSKQHKKSEEILKKYEKYNLNYALLSDFDRSETNRVWGKVSSEFYEHIKSALLSYYEYIYEKRNISIVIYENISNAFSYFAFYVAKEKGIKYYGIGGSRLPGRFSITDDPLEDNIVGNNFNKILNKELSIKEDAIEFAENYLNNIEKITPDYMRFNKLNNLSILRRYLNFEKINLLPLLFSHALDKKNDAFLTGNPLLSYFNLFLRNIKRRIRINFVKNIYDNPSSNRGFLLYPLHFHPEASTSILAGAYLNEYEVIKNIAFSLPQGVDLYVKDHISAWGYQSLCFYKKIKKLPNVYLLDPTAPTKKLIMKSRGVITLTSTVGYEALLLKKKVFLFGSVFYEFHKGVVKISNQMKIHDTLLNHLNANDFWDDEYNKNFIYAYYASTYDGTLNLMQGGEGAKILAKKVFEEIRWILNKI